MDPATFPVILTYHSIYPGPSPTQIPAELFAEQVQWLHDNTRVAPLGEVVTALLNRTRLPERTVVLTFDDGYRDFYFSAAPILRRLNMPATIFLPTGLCGAIDLGLASGSWHPEQPLLVADCFSFRVQILEVFAFRSAAVTRSIVIDVLQTGFLGSLRRISCNAGLGCFPVPIVCPTCSHLENNHFKRSASANARRAADIRSASIF